MQYLWSIFAIENNTTKYFLIFLNIFFQLLQYFRYRILW